MMLDFFVGHIIFSPAIYSILAATFLMLAEATPSRPPVCEARCMMRRERFTDIGAAFTKRLHDCF